MLDFRCKNNIRKPMWIKYLAQITITSLFPTLIPTVAWSANKDNTPLPPNLQTQISTQLQAQSLPRVDPPSAEPTPLPSELPEESPRPLLPPPPELLPNSPPTNPGTSPTQITVKRFEIVGGTVFTPAQLAAITNPATNRPIDFAQLLQVASDITQLYVSNGYISSGAYIPSNQSFSAQNGVVKIQIVEGRVEDIIVVGTKRLDPNYIRSRIALGTNQPLKVDRLLDRLRLLQQDPLIANISAELVTGKEPGTSSIQVTVTEAPSKRIGFNVSNSRTPSIGENQGQLSFTENNLLGIGDAFGVSYGATEAANILDFNYVVPVNPMNGTVRLQYSTSNSRVIEAPFQPLDINANAQDIGITYRQPISQSVSQELALGVTLNQRESNINYLPTATGNRIGFPSPGADANGRTKVTAVRFFQDFTSRDNQQVFAVRSQFSLGLNALDATINPTGPDGQFVSWRGQAQYLRAFAPDTILLLKLDSQFSDRPLVPLEQISWGGQDTVRGYRQDVLLGDNGVLASAEMRFPIFSSPETKQLLQIVPFVDFGVAWNNSNGSGNTPNTIASGGLGLRYQNGNNFLAKLEYGIPFTTINSNRRTGQEQGFHFSLNYNYSF
jgi:hemolysin activation/secretion protein